MAPTVPVNTFEGLPLIRTLAVLAPAPAFTGLTPLTRQASRRPEGERIAVGRRLQAAGPVRRSPLIDPSEVEAPREIVAGDTRPEEIARRVGETVDRATIMGTRVLEDDRDRAGPNRRC
jgi:hypothetical protein